MESDEFYLTGIPDKDVAARAEALGLGVRALSSYTKAPMICNGLVLGYGNLEEKLVSEGVRRLVQAVQSQNKNMPKDSYRGNVGG